MKRICVECGKDVDKCDDRFDMIAYRKNGKPYIYKKNVKMIWGNGFKIDKKFNLKGSD